MRLGKPVGLLEPFESIITTSPSLIKIFVSSWEYHDIFLHLEDCPNLEISASRNEADIDAFVHTEVEKKDYSETAIIWKGPHRVG